MYKCVLDYQIYQICKTRDERATAQDLNSAQLSDLEGILRSWFKSEPGEVNR